LSIDRKSLNIVIVLSVYIIIIIHIIDI